MMRAAAFALLAAAALFAANTAQSAGVNVTTYHYDNMRTGWNQNEAVLTQNNVLRGSGGQRFKLTKLVALDDQVDSQPLFMSGETIVNKGVHDVVYVATEGNTLYALDAATGEVLHKRNFGPPVSIDNVPGGCNNNGANIGIMSTPVIDAANNTMYLIAYVFTNGTSKYALHVIDLSTMQDVVKAVNVSGASRLTNGHIFKFNDSVARQRAALLLANGNVYAGFTSFCDFDADQVRGWVLGWKTGTLAPLPANDLTNRLATSPDNFFLSTVWMSGYGPASNAAGDLFFITGNSDYSGTTLDPVNNIAESAVQLSADLTTVKSVFTPDNAVGLEQEDGDFGSGGLMLIPPQPSQRSNFAVGAGKDGTMYFLNADNLNNNTTGAGRILGSYGIGGCWCGPSYYMDKNGHGHVVSSGGGSIGQWLVRGGAHPSLTNEFNTTGISGDQAPGFFTSVSTHDGGQDPVIWAVSHPDSGNGNSVSLYAFSNKQLFTAVAGSWPNTGGDANLVPVVANGHVYVASYQTLAIFGMSSAPSPAFEMPPAPVVHRVALAPGQHEIFGMVRSVSGSTITVAKRDGTMLTVDTSPAEKNKLFAEPTVGHGVLVRGKYTAMNQMAADVVMHAKDHAGMWQADR
ncbi:MAG TPA: hypothetical protein VGF56_02595 [Rhizomicrobium sp.]|jgi:hypothetical protein